MLDSAEQWSQWNLNENNSIILSGFYDIWLGATDIAIEEKWFWNNTGDPLTFVNWEPRSGQPNNYHGSQHCMSCMGKWSYGTGWLYDQCYLNRSPLCEIKLWVFYVNHQHMEAVTKWSPFCGRHFPVVFYKPHGISCIYTIYSSLNRYWRQWIGSRFICWYLEA